MNLRPNGIGGLTGAVLATCKPLALPSANDVWYVNSAGGVDAATPAGKDRQKPLATIGQAQTNAAAGDIVVLMDGHTETRVTSLVLGKAGIDYVGEGSSSGIPTVQLKINAASDSLFVVNAIGIRFWNLKFPASVQSNTGPGASNGKVHVAANKFQAIGCYFELSGNDVFAGMSLLNAVTDVRLENTTFISTATAVATRPVNGLLHIGTVTDLDVVGCVFSDGTVGFGGAAWDGSAGIATRLRALSLSLLLGADVIHHASTTGWVNPQTATNGGRLVW